MKRMILTGTLALAAGLTGLLAQQGKQAPAKGQGKQGEQAQPAQQGQAQLIPGTKSVGESEALMALINAQGNPDATIKAAEELLTKYADTTFKETALLQEANAYQTKRDSTKAQLYAERVLEVNPKSFQATLMLGELISASTKENDLDKEEKLTKATKYLNDTIENLKTAPKPNPQVTDAQWEEGKKFVTAEAHNGLGMIGIVRKKWDVAATEFKTAIDADPQPAYQVRLAMAYQNLGKSGEAVAIVDKLLADPQLHPAIKQVAEGIKASAGKK
jgi:tetratricopeptide (TPR) repeat protein